ncbi:MAG TPA: EVE domain-containing protein [Cyclobacteriaceae bacterium]|nr:EVE domain-containing protein [Cyclobacteriaceae bacterium]
MNYWLLKTEPETFSWDDLVKAGKATWDGVRNPRARNNIKNMKKGDLAFIYHTGDEKSVIGIARVEKEAYPEPGDAAWLVVDLIPEKKLKNPVTLAEVKAESDLKDMTLARVPRLSVQSVEKSEYDKIVKMSNGK